MMAKITPAQLDMVAKKYLEALTAGAGDAKRVTDKLLTNYFFVGLIHLLYPKAKFVNTLRDPVDTCSAVSPSCSRTTCRIAMTSPSWGDIIAGIAN